MTTETELLPEIEYLPCGCLLDYTCVKWNPDNKVVQCHQCGHIYDARDYTRTPSPAQPKCVKCGHRATIDGVCQVGTGPTHPVTGYKAICGCKCEFPPAQPDERLSGIRSRHEELRSVSSVRNANQWKDIDYLLSLLDSQRSPAQPEWLPDDIADEVQRRMDAVVDAAIEWATCEDEEFDRVEILCAAVDSLLQLRKPSKEQQ